ncbi:MAG: aldehyde ferredoxin oxidoreductase C-terminal domain-containing protein, partial [Candidatus Taylorbacteria bacterium]
GLPIKNWRLGKWEEGAIKISGPRMSETMLKKNYYCAGCVVGCGRTVEVTEGDYAPVNGGGPEYETLGFFGGSCMVDDLEAIAKANELCNRYGVDTIDAGNTVAMAMEAYENGLLTEKEAGCKLEWGNGQALVEMIRQIGENRGLGAILGKGITAAAREIGGYCYKYAMHSKGLSLPAHDPRAYTSVALGFATSPRGACHLQAFSHAFERATIMPDMGIHTPLERFTTEGKADLVVKMQHVMALFDALCLCKFDIYGGVDVTLMKEFLNMATGSTFSQEEILLAGERIFNLKRLYNMECGLSAKDDTVPDRILHEPRGSGSAADNLPDLRTMLTTYYQLRGWGPDGNPTPETLSRLNLRQ